MTVTLPYDPDWKALKWAKENCPSYFTNKANKVRRVFTPTGDSFDKVTHIDYYFSDEKDAVLFALRWT